jgi:hypothetical protein
MLQRDCDSAEGDPDCAWLCVACMQGLRLHDNPALLEAARGAEHLYPIFILDPHFLSSGSTYK